MQTEIFVPQQISTIFLPITPSVSPEPAPLRFNRTFAYIFGSSTAVRTHDVSDRLFSFLRGDYHNTKIRQDAGFFAEFLSVTRLYLAAWS
jgi:hypothetical protein